MTKFATEKGISGNKKDLAAKVKALRTLLGMKQSELASRIGVARTQVVAWENAQSGVQPSAESLLKLANLAESFEDKSWFFAGAGIDLKQLNAALNYESKLHRREPSLGPLATISLRNKLRKNPLSLSNVESGSLQLSAGVLPDSQNVIAVKISRAGGRFGLPKPLNVDDLVLVDQSYKTASDFVWFGKGPNREAMCALLVSELPEYPDRSISSDFHSELRKSDDPALAQIASDWCNPTVLFGFILDQPAGAGIQDLPQDEPESLPNKVDSKGTPHRIIFSPRQGVAFPLTPWSTNPSELLSSDIAQGPSFKSAQILGAVIGWIRAPRLVTNPSITSNRHGG